ncbi:MAG: transposase, partial [Candidatus Dojkabacteria bacterium]|nr:transposase [Candidatus Dojkabacteria bacterium]
YGNIVSFKVDKASKHDLKLGKELVKNLKGMLIADRGFIDNKWTKKLFKKFKYGKIYFMLFIYKK